MAVLVEQAGSRVVCNAPAERVVSDRGRVTGVEAGGRGGTGEHFINSLPLRNFIRRLDPAAPSSRLKASANFRYRDFLSVGLIVRGRDLFPDTWIYVHEPDVSVARIQNYTNWSPEMSPDP